jgi:hypothetical protein
MTATANLEDPPRPPGKYGVLVVPFHRGAPPKRAPVTTPDASVGRLVHFNANGSDQAASPSREVIPLERQSFPAPSDPAHGKLGALPTNQLCPAPMISWGGVLSFT